MGEKKTRKGDITLPNFIKELAESGITPAYARENLILEIKNDKNLVAKLLNREPTKTPSGNGLLFIYVDTLGLRRKYGEQEYPLLDSEALSVLKKEYGVSNVDNILTVNYKPEKPLMKEGKPLKYMRPNGSKNVIYFPPSITIQELMNPKNPFMIVEGEKKTNCVNYFNKGYICAGLNGVHNFISRDEEGNAVVLREFSELPLKSRQVSMGYDSDIIVNKDIQKAEDRIVEILQEKGAHVRVLRFPHEDGKKCGADDFIMEKGIEEFKALCKEAGLPAKTSVSEIEEYLTGLKGLSISEASNKIRSVVVPISFKKIEEQKALIKFIAKNSVLSEKDVRELVKNGKSHFQEKKSKTNGKPIITHDSSIHDQDILCGKVVEALKKSGRVYRMGNEVCAFRFSNREAINEDNFGGVVLDHALMKWDGRFKSIPKSEVETLLRTSAFVEGFEEVDLYTDTDTYDDFWQRVKQGYNPDSKIFFDGEEIEIYPSNDKIEKLVEEYCFKNEASKNNFFGSLLTVILRPKWVGGKAFFAITGNQPGLGKSQLAQLGVLIGTGLNPDYCKYDRNDAEFGKTIGSQMDITDIINIDNVVDDKPIRSPSLQMLITAPIPSFRRLNHSAMIKRKNTMVVYMTLNNAVFVRDLLDRMCPIELWYEGASHKRKYKNQDLVGWTLKHRKELIGTLIWWIENWKKAGMPTVDVDCRFRNWAGVIGGILKVNGYDKFMTNFETARNGYTQENIEAGELFLNHLNQELDMMEILNLAEKYHLFKDIVGKPNAQNKLGNLLTGMLDIDLPLPLGGTFSLKKGKHSTKRTVIYTAVSNSKNEDEDEGFNEKMNFNEGDDNE